MIGWYVIVYGLVAGLGGLVFLSVVADDLILAKLQLADRVDQFEKAREKRLRDEEEAERVAELERRVERQQRGEA